MTVLSGPNANPNHNPIIPKTLTLSLFLSLTLTISLTSARPVVRAANYGQWWSGVVGGLRQTDPEVVMHLSGLNTKKKEKISDIKKQTYKKPQTQRLHRRHPSLRA